MATTETFGMTFNGVIDTTQPVMENLQTMCGAAKSWLTFDINTGKWAVVINKPGTSVASFNNTNIIGGINVSGTGLTELYNKVRVDFPHVDLNDQNDFVSLDIPTVERFDNERENTLEMSFNIINDPIHAQMIGGTELKQSRVDKIIEFRTDYSKLGLKAGDLIDVTAEMYAFTNKMFRIVTIAEEDSDDGTIQLSITALEYDADVYNYTDLTLTSRGRANGIIPNSNNTSVTASNNNAATKGVSDSLLDPTNVALVALLMNALTRSGNDSGINGPIGVSPLVYSFLTSFQQITDNSTNPVNVNLGYSKTVPLSGIYKIKYNINWGGGANGTSATGVYKTSQISYRINSGPIIGIDESATGDGAVQVYEDHIIEGVIGLTAGQTITFFFTYATNWPTAVFLVNAELLLLQRV